MKPCRPKTLRKVKNPCVLKTVSFQTRVDKYSKYGLYEYNGSLCCRPCTEKVDYTREDTITPHVISETHDIQAVKQTRGSNTGACCHI